MLTVLIIEDDPGDARLIRTWLGLEAPGQYRLLTADRLAKAEEILHAQTVDVVLADLSLPDSHGLDTVRRLGECLGDAALIVFSGNEDEDAAIATMRVGGQDFLVKGHVDGFLLRRSINYAVERRRLELELEDSKARFRNFANSSCDWFWETDAEHRFTYFSDTFERATGENPHHLIGRTRADLMKDRDCEGNEEHRELLTRHQPFQDFEYWIDLPNGATRCFRVGGVPVFGRRNDFRGYQGVGSDITVRKELEERIARLAMVDALTNLPNRAAFEDALQRAAARNERHGSATAILYLDLDGFKAVNDTLGHAAGDELLREVSLRLRKCFRTEDMVARLGGDEFAALVTVDPQDAYRQAEATAQRIVEAVSVPVEVSGGQARVSASIGVAVHPDCSPSIENCVRDADGAMYAAKRSGKGRWVCVASAPAADRAETRADA